LQMIQTIMSDPDNSYLLIIGAYRDNEVTASHPLMLMLGELAKSGTLHETLTLGPLTLDHLTELVSGVVRTDASEARPLAEIVMAKTAGNPFFANVFLASLHREGLLKYDPAAGRWRWDAAQIEAKGYTDNVVEFMADKILTLDEKTRASLKTAACLGNQFNLHELAVVLEQSPRDTAAALWEAVREGLVQTPQIVYATLRSSRPRRPRRRRCSASSSTIACSRRLTRSCPSRNGRRCTCTSAACCAGTPRKPDWRVGSLKSHGISTRAVTSSLRWASASNWSAST